MVSEKSDFLLADSAVAVSFDDHTEQSECGTGKATQKLNHVDSCLEDAPVLDATQNLENISDEQHMDWLREFLALECVKWATAQQKFADACRTVLSSHTKLLILEFNEFQVLEYENQKFFSNLFGRFRGDSDRRCQLIFRSFALHNGISFVNMILGTHQNACFLKFALREVRHISFHGGMWFYLSENDSRKLQAQCTRLFTAQNMSQLQSVSILTNEDHFSILSSPFMCGKVVECSQMIQRENVAESTWLERVLPSIRNIHVYQSLSDKEQDLLKRAGHLKSIDYHVLMQKDMTSVLGLASLQKMVIEHSLVDIQLPSLSLDHIRYFLVSNARVKMDTFASLKNARYLCLHQPETWTGIDQLIHLQTLELHFVQLCPVDEQVEGILLLPSLSSLCVKCPKSSFYYRAWIDRIIDPLVMKYGIRELDCSLASLALPYILRWCGSTQLRKLCTGIDGHINQSVLLRALLSNRQLAQFTIFSVEKWKEMAQLLYELRPKSWTVQFSQRGLTHGLYVRKSDKESLLPQQ